MAHRNFDQGHGEWSACVEAGEAERAGKWVVWKQFVPRGRTHPLHVEFVVALDDPTRADMIATIINDDLKAKWKR